MHPVGFEPTPPKRTELESVALDHSATDALSSLQKYYTYERNISAYPKIDTYVRDAANSEIRTRDPLFTKQMH